VEYWPELHPELLAPVPEREELRQIVRDVLAKHAVHEQVRAAADSVAGYSENLWQLLNAELEISRLAVPEDRGGNGFGLQELFVVVEECGAALLSEPILSSAVLGCQALVAADDPTDVEDLVDAALGGELLVTVASGAEPLAAVEDAVGGWLVSGTRTEPRPVSSWSTRPHRRAPSSSPWRRPTSRSNPEPRSTRPAARPTSPSSHPRRGCSSESDVLLP
jgi:acyl-CoA dehydrogenase